MIKHPFNKSWYDKYDNVAKDTLVTYLKGVGHDVGEVKEDYNVDVVSTKKDFTYFNEAEVIHASNFLLGNPNFSNSFKALVLIL